MDYLDKQMQAWSTRLRDDLKIGPPESNEVASTIAREVASLSAEAKQRVRAASQILRWTLSFGQKTGARARARCIP